MEARRIISVFTLCLLVLTSGSNFVIGMHLCGGHIQDIVFLGEAKRCSNEKQMPACHHQASKPCCENKTIVHKAEDIKASANQIHFTPSALIQIDVPSLVIAEIIPSSSAKKLEFCNYDPPLPATDRVVSFQVFII